MLASSSASLKTMIVSRSSFFTPCAVHLLLGCFGVKKEERETIIVFNEADDEASIYTFNTDLKKRLAAFAKRFPQLARLDRVFPEGAVEYVIDKDRLSIRFTAPYSEERRKAASEYARQHSKLVVG